MNIIDLETPLETEKYIAPLPEKKHPFFIPEYGKTFPGTPCYQLRLSSPFGCVQYVISGSGVIMCNDKIVTVCEGDTFLLPEGSNQIYYSNPDNHFERIWINYEGELASSLLKIYEIEDTFVFRKMNTHDILEEIHTCCRKNTNPEIYKQETARLFLKLVQFLSENNKAVSDVHPPVEQLRHYIDCHITQNIKLADIAKQLCYSPEHIIRVFKKQYGITPHQYIIQSKIRLAMIMLRSTDSSIEEISEKLSFSDPHHFSAQFQKHTGERPSSYRRKFRIQ